MTSKFRPYFSARFGLEDLFAISVICGLGYSTYYLITWGVLPSPFFYDPSDTFGDWYNPAFWARQGRAAYDIWGSFYTPLSFIFLRLVGIDRCYPDLQFFAHSSGIIARGCDWVGLVAMAVIYLVNAVLTWRTFRMLDRSTAVNRSICLILGMPMLQAMERGNLVMLAYTCMVLALGPLVKSARVRILFMALTVNFKLYFIAAIAGVLLKRRWYWVELALVSSLIIYLFTVAIYGSGTPNDIIKNLVAYQIFMGQSILDTWFAATYDALLSSSTNGAVPLASILGSRVADGVEIFIPLLKLTTQMFIAAAAFAVWYRPEGVSQHRAVLLGLLFIFISTESGIYILLFLSYFIMMEKWKGFALIWAISVCYILAIPADITIVSLPETPQESYFREGIVMVGIDIPVGPFVRPLLITSIAWAISWATISEVYKRVYGLDGDGSPSPKLATDGYRDTRDII